MRIGDNEWDIEEKKVNIWRNENNGREIYQKTVRKWRKYKEIGMKVAKNKNRR